ncbi:hypothetical protein CJ010_23700 [Azoarcus sp. DD4]|nr:hypothetical protein CJ010_15535 [Azoarcus sp. DD4]QDF99880.1 hypothetical protein CJ010_23700 [Azoarcus sp. DD4]
MGTKVATNGRVRVTRKGCPNHPVDFKRRLAGLACEPGISVAKLALEHGVNANLLFKWRRHYRAGKFGTPLHEHAVTELPLLLPVLTTAPALPQEATSGASGLTTEIEIVLNGATVRVRGAVRRSTLAMVLDCLAARA